MPYVFPFHNNPQEDLMTLRYRISRATHSFRHALTRYAAGAFALLLCAGVVAHTAEAQAPALGDSFIFFVDGVNPHLEGVDGGEVVADPKDGDNKVLKLDNGNYNYHGFRFGRGNTTAEKTGSPRDLTANRDAGNVLHFRIMVDPANPNMDGSGDIVQQYRLAIQFEDYRENQGEAENSNNPFRLRWAIADSLRDGEWHTVSVTLPPATWAELEAAKTDGSLSGHESQWLYAGSWAGFSIGLDLLGPDATADRADLWTEFEWDNVEALGIQWDWGEAENEGAPIYLDDVYIGPAGLDLSDAKGEPAAMSNIMGDGDGPVNVVSWTHNPDFGGYNVYWSAAPITDVTADEVYFLAKVSEAPYEARHEIEIPHSFSVEGSTLYYAVTSLSQFGVENRDVSGSAVAIDNQDLAVSPAILSLTPAQDNTLFDAVNAGTVSKEGFPDESMPFVVDDMHSQLSENGVTLPASNDDLSASVWVAYFPGDVDEGLTANIWVYAEVTDDVADYAPANIGENEAWKYDSIEIGWGSYDVRDAGGTILSGSPHENFMRGNFPDYQLRLSPHGSKADAVARTFVSSDVDTAPAGGAAYAATAKGYNILAAFDTSIMQKPEDTPKPFPGEGEVRFMPFTITLNDADGEGNDPPRVHQITWSNNPTVDNTWWNTPSQWQVVAMVGPGGVTSSEGDSELPTTHALEQNYPNPFNPATTIRFQLPQAEQVTLRVFDVLGREVAALLDDASMTAGAHTVRFDATGLTSGVYLYRLEAGASFVQTRRMLLVK